MNHLNPHLHGNMNNLIPIHFNLDNLCYNLNMNQAAKTESVSSLEVTEKIPLTVPLIVNAFNNGKTQADISRICNVSEQAVSEYRQRHDEEIMVLTDKSDSILALQHKMNTYKASRNLSLCLENATTKKEIIANVAVIDRLTPAFRLLQDKSTSNLAIQDVSKRRQELEKELAGYD